MVVGGALRTFPLEATYVSGNMRAAQVPTLCNLQPRSGPDAALVVDRGASWSNLADARSLRSLTMFLGICLTTPVRHQGCVALLPRGWPREMLEFIKVDNHPHVLQSDAVVTQHMP